jgi:uncharacterized membrane protein
MTSATQTPSLLERAVQMIGECKLLDDAKRVAYLDAIAEGRFTPDMARELAAAFRAEAAGIDEEIRFEKDVIQAATAELSAAETEAAVLDEQGSALHFGAMEDAASDFQNVCATAVRTMDGVVENEARSGEAGEMDAIRQMLKKKD